MLKRPIGHRYSVAFVFLVLACSDGSDDSPGSNGGFSGSGGTGNLGGGTQAAKGGTATSGGTATNGSGGASTGGSKATSGGTTTSVGGSATSLGGASAGGATTSSGGASTSAGGAIAMGGSLANAGGPSSGGAVTAGTTASGGTTAAAGAMSKGGTSNVAGSAGKGGSAAGGISNLAGAAGAAGHQATCPVPAGAEMPEATAPPGYCAWVFAQGLSRPRGMIADAQGQLLLVETTGANAVTLLWDANGDRVNQTSERLRIANAPGINHGIALYGGYLYASSDTTVYRWPYDGSRTALANRETVLTGLPTGGHSTRTLVFDSAGNLYVSIGSSSNLDANSARARVVRLDAARASATGATLADTTVFADGTRNEVGLAFDSRGRLWGVENGSDNLNRADLGGDIHIDNPAEELNLFAQAGDFYGYPYCWTEGNLPSGVGMGPGTQWAYPSVMNDGTHTDAWCRNEANVRKPIAVMQAHTAPLDIMFYRGNSFPADVVGDAIVSLHGSWNRTPATGYKVVVIPFGDDGMPNGNATPLLESAAAGDTGGGWTHRPVSLAHGSRGEVYVTSDADGLVMAVGHE